MSIASQIKSKTGKRYGDYDEDALIEVHHLLMREYGWIPLMEFMELPLPTLFNLMDCIKREKEAEARAMEKAKRKR